jgi:hypothetical protein
MPIEFVAGRGALPGARREPFGPAEATFARFRAGAGFGDTGFREPLPAFGFAGEDRRTAMLMTPADG